MLKTIIMKSCLAIFIRILLSFSILKTGIAKKTSIWQCSLLSQSAIQSLVEQNSEAFRVIGWPKWMSKNVEYKYINCSKKGLKQIPQGLNRIVEVLDLRRNSITHIRKNDFFSYSSLVAISMIDNCVISFFRDSTIRRCSGYLTVEKGAFSRLTKLKYLALSLTAMKQLPEMLPQNIQVLMASFASLSPIERKAVMQLTSLKLVSFSSNCLSADKKHFCARNFTISESVFSSPKLKFLDLAYNNFASVPGYLFQQSLVGIKLRGNPLNWIRSNDFVNATNITYLSLAWTSQYIKTPLQIEKTSFHLLRNLEILDLSANMISTLPEDIFAENSLLKALNLELNCLNKIETNPTILPSLPFLEQLSLGGNTFCTDTLKPVKHTQSKLKFGNEYLRFPNLTTLSLGILQQFPDTDFGSSFLFMYLSYGSNYDRVDSDSFKVLKKLPRLKNLGLAACGIRVLNTLAFDGLDFDNLDLQINRIGEETKKSKTKLRLKRHTSSQKVTDITTYNDQYFNLNDLDNYAFYKTFHKKVSSANFSRNAIANFQTFSLKYLSFVIHLDLSRNNINFIYEDDFRNLSLLQVLDLRYNPIRYIHHRALTPLLNLAHIRLNLTKFQGQLSVEFLLEAHQNFTFDYGDKRMYIYRLFQYYRNRNISVYFPKVTSMDLSYIRIPIFLLSNNQPLFEPLCNLINLKLDGTQITYHPQSNFFGGVLKLRHLSMRESWLEEFPYLALKPLRYLEYLDLSHNKIEVLKKHLNISFPNLKTLILSYNFIYKIFPGTLRSFSNNGLLKIDLSFNQIKNIDPSVIDRIVLQKMDCIDLRGNVVSCDCSLSDTFGWLIHLRKLNNSKLPGFLPDCSNAVVYYYGGCIACDESTSSKPLSLFTYTITTKCDKQLFFLVACFNVIILSFLFIALSFKVLKKKLLKFLLNEIRVQSFQTRSNDNVSSSSLVYAYHGFIYYDKDNAEVGNWVEKLLTPKLNTEYPSFKMGVVGTEDWCGTTQVQQLLLKVRASRKVIVILSGNFLSTPKCQYVLSVLEEWFYKTNKDKCIIIVYENADIDSTIPNLFRKIRRHDSLAMLQYSLAEEQLLFWDVLANAILL